MRKFLLAAALAGVSVLAITSCGQNGGDLRKPAGKEWPAAGGDWGNTRYSTLDKINVANVKELGGAWQHKFDNGERPAGAPIVANGMMFIATNAQMYALDPKTGATIWMHKP